MLLSALGLNDAKTSSVVGIAGVTIETMCYGSDSLIGLRSYPIVNVLFLP
jgi:hypothetical protein